MKTVPYTEVLQQAVELTGRAYVDGDGAVVLRNEEERVFRNLIGRANKRIHTAQLWPETRKVQQRFFAQTAWRDAPLDVVAGDLRYDPPTESYYQALRDSSGQYPTNDGGSGYEVNSAYWVECTESPKGSEWDSSTAYPIGSSVLYLPNRCVYVAHTYAPAGTLPTNAEYFGQHEPFVTTIDWTSDFGEDIGDVFGAYETDPRIGHAKGVAFQFDQTGILFDRIRPFVWLEFREPAPSFSTAPATLYARFGDFAAMHAAGLMLRMDGKADSGNELLAAAETVLNDECDTFTRQEGQVRMVEVRR
jgi:hypothetical protein